MTTYRTGNHWGVTIVREGDRSAELDDCAFCCVSSRGCPTHPPVEDQLVAVVVNGDRALAERICALLNGEEAFPRERLGVWPEPYEGPKGEHSACTWGGVCKVFPDLRHEFVQPLAADSCTCPQTAWSTNEPDPDCPVHHGRRARGPKPPPVGLGCICDGSGRTCPRHGVVI